MELGRRDEYFSQRQNTERGLAGPSYEDLTRRNASIVGVGVVDKPNLCPDVESNSPANGTQRHSITVSTSETQPSNTFQPAFPSNTVLSSPPESRPHLAFENKLKLPTWKSMTSATSTNKRLEKAQLMEEQLHRQPPTTPVLQPVHRFCLIDGFVKPYRAHHCQSCETVSCSHIKSVISFLLITLFECSVC
jgi:palmitoyltransferase